MVEIKVKEIEKEEGYTSLPEGICPECQKKMVKIGKKFKCFKCGMVIEK